VKRIDGLRQELRAEFGQHNDEYSPGECGGLYMNQVELYTRNHGAVPTQRWNSTGNLRKRLGYRTSTSHKLSHAALCILQDPRRHIRVCLFQDLLHQCALLPSKREYQCNIHRTALPRAPMLYQWLQVAAWQICLTIEVRPLTPRKSSSCGHGTM
jgi:hypothetical protein